MAEGNGWSEYQKLVLYRLDELSEKLESVGADVSKLKSSVTVLKLKVAFIGAVSGTFGSALVFGLVKYFMP